MSGFDYTGARGSNAGDSFHELWALRAALALLDIETDLSVLTVEGIREEVAAGNPADSWEGVDCGLYYGGGSMAAARKLELVQLKYSASDPDHPWGVADLTYTTAKRINNSVLARLGESYKSARQNGAGQSGRALLVKFVTNRPVREDIRKLFQDISAQSELVEAPRKGKKEGITPQQKLLIATGLTPELFSDFCRSLVILDKSDSRFRIEEQVIAAVGDWIDGDARVQVNNLLQYIRTLMAPERSREFVTRESVLAQFGVSDPRALFPCPPLTKPVEGTVQRKQATQIRDSLVSGSKYLCLHGEGGCGKTTLLQEIGTILPERSLLIVYDCYGAGSYLHSDSYRHRAKDAFVQLSNELAAALMIPLVLVRSETADYPRLFKERLERASEVLGRKSSDALLVVAIDAADNSLTAAERCLPPESSFIPAFIRLGNLPANVRLIVSTRTGGKPSLNLPSAFAEVQIEGFTIAETSQHVQRFWSGASPVWLEDFHYLSNHNPRVQAYALTHSVKASSPEAAIGYLRPNGKGLDDVFRAQIADAVKKDGDPLVIARFCAALAVMPRPVPLAELAAVAAIPQDQLKDICADLSPGVQQAAGATISLADEDFERFLQQEGFRQVAEVKRALAERLWTNKATDEYAARHVANSLMQANREKDLIDLVTQEPEPRVISDPILKREIQLERLGLAIRACSQINDVISAAKTMIIGSEAITTNGRIKARIIGNADLAATCSAERASSLILTDPAEFKNHGVLLFHLLLQDARRSDALQVRERLRQIRAWMDARKARMSEEEDSPRHHDNWPLEASEIAAEMEAVLLIYGPEQALRQVKRWRPRSVLLSVLGSVARSLLASGRQDLVKELLDSDHLPNAWKMFLAVPMARSGNPVDTAPLVRGLNQLRRRGVISTSSLGSEWRESGQGEILDVILSACEIALSNDVPYEQLADVIRCFDEPATRQGRHLSLYSTSLLDLQMRALSLSKVHAEEALTLETFWIVDRDANLKPLANSGVTREREEENQRFLKPLLHAYEMRAKILLKKVPDDELQAAIDTISVSSALDEYGTRRLLEAGQMRYRAAESLAGLTFVKKLPSERLVDSALRVLGPLAGSLPKEGLKSILPLTLVPSLHARCITIISEAAQGLSRRRMPASERIDALVRFSRFLMPISAEAANALFLDALASASGIDEEVVMQIRVLLGLSKTAASTLKTNERSEICSRLAAIAADAAVRLDAPEGFPWGNIAAGLSRLDVSFSLAAIARWEDAGIVERNTLLSVLLEEAVSSGVFSSAETTALLPLVEAADEGLLKRIVEAVPPEEKIASQILELLAKDELLRYGRGGRTGGLDAVQAWNDRSGWMKKLREAYQFLQAQDGKRKKRQSSEWVTVQPTVGPEVIAGISLVKPEGLLQAIDAVTANLRSMDKYPTALEALQAILPHVRAAERFGFLETVGDLIRGGIAYYMAHGLHRALSSWHTDPAVRRWAAERLPDVVRRELVNLGSRPHDDGSPITDLLRVTGLTALQISNLFVAGLVQNADQLSAEVALPLVELVTAYLTGEQAAELLFWYSSRVFSRIQEQDQDVIDVRDVPRSAREGVGRFLFAMMSDVDVRIRWRAAHAVRRLAWLSCKEVLSELAEVGNRIVEASYRLPKAPFYWLAARLWLVVSVERSARESAPSLSDFVPLLKQVALDDQLPHLLLREFAKNALRHLEANGVAVLSEEESKTLTTLNRTPFRRKKKQRFKRATKKATTARKTKHLFDWVDTIPYVYDPWISGFFNVSQQDFLSIADRWISDVWRVREDIGHWAEEERQHRFPENNYGMWYHSHGSEPVLERPAYYYEWHAMWCTLGELIRDRPLAAAEDWSWNDFEVRLSREMLTVPTMWLADLRDSKPLLARFWFPPEDEAEQWVNQDDREETLAELGLSEGKREEIVVAAFHATQASSFRSDVYLSTALVSRDTAGSLLRALQTTAHWMRYKVPSQDDDLEINEALYRFIGWLQDAKDRDPGIDKFDPLRNDVREVQTGPGTAVLDFLGVSLHEQDLLRTSNTFPFRFEVWSDRSELQNQRGYRQEGIASSGNRLWIDRLTLQKFLKSLNMDMIVEVRVSKRDRGSGFERYGHEKETNKDVDHVFLLRNTGEIEGSSGSLGAWTTSGQRTRSRRQH